MNTNKKIGLLIIGIGLLIGYMIYAFNTAISGALQMNNQCSLDVPCPHEIALKFETNISLIILAIVIGIGIAFLFAKEKSVQNKKQNLEKIKMLDKDEKKIYELTEKEGSIFQSDLVEKSGFDKVKVTRILDRLEGKQLIERKRRGMTNIVIVK